MEFGLEHGNAFGQIGQHRHRLRMHANVMVGDLALDCLIVRAVDRAAIRRIAIIVAAFARELARGRLTGLLGAIESHTIRHDIWSSAHLALNIDMHLVKALFVGIQYQRGFRFLGVLSHFVLNCFFNMHV